MAVNYFRIKASDIRGNKWQLARISPTAQKYDFKFPMKALHTIANITMGQSPLGNTYNDKKQGLPFYQGKTLFSNKYILEPKTWTTDPKKIAYHNDILISVRAPVGSVNLCSLPEICIGRGLGAIRASKEANQEYLFYILLIFTNLIKGNHGATFEMIASDELANSLIPLPPMKIQQEIADIMDHAYAEKQRLESEARELLNSIDSYVMNELGIEQTQQITTTNKWFTVKAKDLRGQRWDPNYIVDNPHYQFIFDTVLFEEISISTQTGLPVRKDNRSHDGIYPYYGANGIIGYMDEYTHSGEYFICGQDGYIGNHYIVTDKFWASNHNWVSKIDTTKININYLKYYMDFIDYSYLITGGVIPKLTKEALLGIKIPLPPINIQQEIALECETRRNTAQQNQQLAQDILAKAKADVEKMLFK